MVSNKEYEALKQAYEELKEENELLHRRNVELEAAFNSVKKEYERRPVAELPKFYITSDKYLQMISYLKDKIIREGGSLTDIGSLLMLDKAAELAEK